MAGFAPPTDTMSDEDFIEDAELSYFIPLATEFDIERALKQKAETNQAGLDIDSIERRNSLFFDESVDVYLVLKIPYLEDNVLRSYIRRLVISLEAHIVNSNTPDRDGPPASENIYTGTADQIAGPLLIYDERNDGAREEDDKENNGEEDGQERYVHVAWKLPVLLVRPRMRMQDPSVVFTAEASLKPPELFPAQESRDGYLTSGQASGLNLLEGFGSDPALGGVQPRLSALRVSRVTPVTHQAKDLLRPLKSSQEHLALRVFPAVHSRIRFSRPNSTPPTPVIIAMLELDFTPFFECEIALTAISMSVEDGTVEDLTSQPALSLPMPCVAYDHITFLYRIAPEDTDGLAKNPTRDLQIKIVASALVQPGVCTPTLTMAWTATVDFTLPVNPGFGSAMQPLQRGHRPSQLSINSITSLASPSVARPDAIPSLETATIRTDVPVPELGLTITFTTPPPTQKIYRGDVFIWTVFVVNRAATTSSTAPSRKLALVAIPKRRRNESRVNRPPSLSGPIQSKTPRDRSVADAVLDENVVHAMQQNSAVDCVEMICLSADVRIGPLAPGACHVAEMRFMALKTGFVGVEAIRIVDLTSSEHVDVRDLPTVVVEDEDEEQTGFMAQNTGLVTASA